jgi:hypothetical protein
VPSDDAPALCGTVLDRRGPAWFAAAGIAAELVAVIGAVRVLDPTMELRAHAASRHPGCPAGPILVPHVGHDATNSGVTWGQGFGVCGPFGCRGRPSFARQ